MIKQSNNELNFKNKLGKDIIDIFISSDSIETQDENEIKDYLNRLEYSYIYYNVNLDYLQLPYFRLYLNKDNTILLGESLKVLLERADIPKLQQLSELTNSNNRKELVQEIYRINKNYREQYLGLNNNSSTSVSNNANNLATKEEINSIVLNSIRTDYEIIKLLPPSNNFPEAITDDYYASKLIKSLDFHNPSNHILENIIVTEDLEILNKVIQKLGFVNFKGTRMESINMLLWYMTMKQKIGNEFINLEFRLNKEQIKYVMKLNKKQLLSFTNISINLVNYDRIHLIFLLCTGYLPDQGLLQSSKKDLNNYNYLTSLDYNNFVNIFRYLYDYYYNDGVTNPYYWMSQEIFDSEDDRLSQYLIDIDETNVEERADELGMIFPIYKTIDGVSILEMTSNLGGLGEEEELSNEDYLIYFLENIKYYVYLLQDKNFEPIEDILEDLSPAEIFDRLKYLSDVEIIEEYDIMFTTWASRLDLIQKIVNDITTKTDHWSYRNIYDNILSYGIQNNKDYYNLEEFAESFGIDEDIFIYEKDSFTVASIKQLLNLLKTQPLLNLSQTSEIVKKFEKGLRQINNKKQGIYYEFKDFKEKNKNRIYNYISNLIVLMLKINKEMTFESCFGFRDNTKLTIKEQDVINTIYKEYDQIVKILNDMPNKVYYWIENLPIVTYEDDNLYEPMIHNSNLHQIITSLLTGSLCVNVAIDLILSSIVYIYRIGFRMQDDDVNSNIRKYTGSFQTVNSKLLLEEIRVPY